MVRFKMPIAISIIFWESKDLQNIITFCRCLWPSNMAPKRREKNYTEKLNTVLPRSFHRGDIHSTSRLQGYCDAMYATCATFLVLPLRNLKEMKEDDNLTDFIQERTPEYVIFFIGFLLNHNLERLKINVIQWNCNGP